MTKHHETEPNERYDRLADQIFVGGGEVGALCRAKDWSATPLGPVEYWSQSLKTAANIVTSSIFPMIILWGPQYIQVYNDGYRLIMGTKHPTGLGQPSLECWPEVTAIVEPLYTRVMAGETIAFEEELFQLAPNGYLEDIYLTLCYSPLRNETGQVGGIFVTVFNITDEVLMRSERDRALAEAQSERQRLAQVFMQAPAAIAVLEGPEHTFTVANPLYLKLIGGRDIIGKSIRAAMPELSGQGIYELLDNVRRSGEPFTAAELNIQLDRDNDGVPEDLYVDFVYQPLKNATGDVFGIMVHVVETTPQVLARLEIEKKADELFHITHALARSNRELDQFAYVTSHDLKAPLRGIANLATWIEEDLDGNVNAEIQHHMELLRGRVHRMEALIDGILSYSRAGRIQSQPEPIDTGALVREVVELQAFAEDVQVEIQPNMPTVLAERVPFQQLFMNLIANAVKYTQPTRSDIVVQIGWRDDGNTYVFSVSDNGPGIAPEYHDRIWGIFQTLEARDKVEGTGIGLAIVKKIVESAGGRAWVISSAGEGATFFFTWNKPALQ